MTDRSTNDVSPTRDLPRLPGKAANLQLMRWIGEGTRASVYLAGFGAQRVVIKQYHPRQVRKHQRRFHRCIAQYEFQRNQFLYDQEPLRPFVARPVGVITWPGIPTACFVQEYVDGPTLDQWVQRYGQIPQAVIDDLEQLARIIAAHGVFDLDLKPHNIGLTRSPGGLKPVLFDFNSVPHAQRAPNPWIGLLYRIGARANGHEDRRDLSELQIVARTGLPDSVSSNKSSNGTRF